MAPRDGAAQEPDRPPVLRGDRVPEDGVAVLPKVARQGLDEERARGGRGREERRGPREPVGLGAGRETRVEWWAVGLWVRVSRAV